MLCFTLFSLPLPESVASSLLVIRCKYILIYLIKQINDEQNTKIDRYSFIPINLTLQIMLYFHANEKKQYLYR